VFLLLASIAVFWQSLSALYVLTQEIEPVTSHGWLGNVRELENRIKRAIVMAEGGYVTPESLELQDTVSSIDGSTLKASRDHREKKLVRLAMEKAEGNVTHAASSLE